MRRTVIAVSVAAVAALTLSACSSSGSKDSGSSGGSGGGDIKIMQIAADAVVGSGNNQEPIEAWVASVNAKGGIGGHKIDYQYCNAGAAATNGDPNTTAQCAQKAVKAKVVALVGTFTSFSQNLYPYIQKAGIPNINQQFSAADQTNALSYTQAGNAPVAYAGVSAMLAKNGCKKIGILAVGTEATVGALVVTPFQLGAKQAGIEALKPQYIDPTATDYAPAMAVVRAGGADCLAFEGTAANTAPIMKAIDESGGPMKVGVNDISVPKEVMAALSAKDQAQLLVETLNYPEAWQTAGIKQYLSDMKTYKPNAVRVDYTQLLWGYGKIFEQAAKKVVAANKEITAANIKSALDTICETDNDIAPPANYCKPGQIKKIPRVSETSNAFMTIKNGEYVPQGTGPADGLVDVGPALADYDPNG
ncbi:MAG: hypothetical protein JWN95_2090 [Frankiales bacterium]|nr:hypothetical protein [Frankiales bacterium]